MKILFSPLGDTDPVRNDYDGAMLHIIRHEAPELAVLYYTQEMEKKDRKDNRFELLIKRVQPETGIRKIYSGIEAAHDFDVFINQFQPCLDELHREYPDAELLVNISSGTPAIKTALCLEVAALPYTVRAIQVSTPYHKSNRGIGHQDDFSNIDDVFCNLMDNEAEVEKRLKNAQLSYFKYVRMKTTVEALVEDFDFNGAYIVAGENKDLLKEYTEGGLDLLVLMDHARHRYNLRLDTANNILDKLPSHLKDRLRLRLDSQEAAVVEAFAVTRIKRDKAEYVDFLLRLSPIWADLAEIFITKIIKLPIDQAMENKNDYTRINFARLEKICARYADGIAGYLDGKTGRGWEYPSLALYLRIAEYMIGKYSETDKQKQNSIFEKLKDVRDVEGKVRNLAAHEIVSLSDEKIKRKCGKGTDIITAKTEVVLMEILAGRISRSDMDVYGRINECIRELLVRK